MAKSTFAMQCPAKSLSADSTPFIPAALNTRGVMVASPVRCSISVSSRSPAVSPAKDREGIISKAAVEQNEPMPPSIKVVVCVSEDHQIFHRGEATYWSAKEGTVTIVGETVKVSPDKIFLPLAALTLEEKQETRPGVTTPKCQGSEENDSSLSPGLALSKREVLRSRGLDILRGTQSRPSIMSRSFCDILAAVHADADGTQSSLRADARPFKLHGIGDTQNTTVSNMRSDALLFVPHKMQEATEKAVGADEAPQSYLDDPNPKFIMDASVAEELEKDYTRVAVLTDEENQHYRQGLAASLRLVEGELVCSISLDGSLEQFSKHEIFFPITAITEMRDCSAVGGRDTCSLSDASTVAPPRDDNLLDVSSVHHEPSDFDLDDMTDHCEGTARTQ